MDAHRDAVIEGEPPVTRDVVGVRVGLEHADDAHLPPLRLGEQRLDRIRRIDRHRLVCAFAADQVGGAPEVVVQELLEEHGDDGTSGARYLS